MILRKSYKEQLEDMRRESAFRYQLGTIFIIAGLLLLAGSVIWALNIQDQILATAGTLFSLDQVQAHFYTAYVDAHSRGLEVGFTLAGSLAIGTIACVQGLFFLLGYREERRLIRIFSEEGPPD